MKQNVIEILNETKYGASFLRYISISHLFDVYNVDQHSLFPCEEAGV